MKVLHQILDALRRKVTLSEDIDVQEYARLTEGYSGADLQALVYNAHLDAVHASIADSEAHKPLPTSNVESTSAPTYASFGGTSSASVLSRADQSVREKRVRASPYNICTDR